MGKSVSLKPICLVLAQVKRFRPSDRVPSLKLDLLA